MPAIGQMMGKNCQSAFLSEQFGTSSAGETMTEVFVEELPKENLQRKIKKKHNGRKL